VKLAATAVAWLLFAPITGPVAPTVAQIALPRSEAYLRLDWEAASGRAGRQRITGYAYNDRDYWATSVQLLAESLDASGQVVGSASTTILGTIPPRNRGYFSIDGVPPAATYRVTVRSVDWRGYGGGGS
jgi:hypothetical protein